MTAGQQGPGQPIPAMRGKSTFRGINCDALDRNHFPGKVIGSRQHFPDKVIGNRQHFPDKVIGNRQPLPGHGNREQAKGKEAVPVARGAALDSLTLAGDHAHP
jgi:hypothetical protein